MILRNLEKIIQKDLKRQKVLIILGARQTGKTTLLKKMFAPQSQILWLNGDEYDVQRMFDRPTSTQLRNIIANNHTVIIDEAQRIENIGIGLKLIYDNYPEIQLIVTGSSALELKNKFNEPLTGRKIEYSFFSLSFEELVHHHGLIEEKRNLEHRLIYGSYPAVIVEPYSAANTLKWLTDSYLYKDILMLDNIKKPEKLILLLQALAFQVGSEVSYSEIGNLIGLNNKSVEHYIQLLEKSFIVFRLHSLCRNARNELKMAKKIYFYDNGIRNAVINQFQPIASRQDVGALFENYLISERKKWLHLNQIYTNTYFWRTKEQQEIDYIEETNGLFSAFEFKWNPNKKVLFSKTFLRAYPESKTQIIHRENYDEFLTQDGIVDWSNL